MFHRARLAWREGEGPRVLGRPPTPGSRPPRPRHDGDWGRGSPGPRIALALLFYCFGVLRCPSASLCLPRCHCGPAAVCVCERCRLCAGLCVSSPCVVLCFPSAPCLSAVLDPVSVCSYLAAGQILPPRHKHPPGPSRQRATPECLPDPHSAPWGGKLPAVRLPHAPSPNAACPTPHFIYSPKLSPSRSATLPLSAYITRPRVPHHTSTPLLLKHASSPLATLLAASPLRRSPHQPRSSLSPPACSSNSLAPSSTLAATPHVQPHACLAYASASADLCNASSHTCSRSSHHANSPFSRHTNSPRIHSTTAACSH